ncbi:flagellar hook-basal body protein [Pseudalkalibacillus berkeleyi]|uniref:Flagellar hook-basal body protein n=1 Tax=Pseudalkalibacillus berkeleyi TaxID=1069813 RepID=A0ABS9H441_9BACL|nr:flagellar hook-basal body protein [Pseudalkalibacillus berkeleyi]MCF6138871.1 flagellar hook-basal body protein [Pseudalkalibacillus berkeleyi]
MNRSMITASVSMGQLQRQLDTISNNLSNSNTYGYKRRNVQFSDLLTQEMNNQPNQNKEVGRLTPNNIRLGNGARVTGTVLRMEQGTVVDTGRSLDIALLNPNMMFQVRKTLENGEEIVEYTREGSFYVTPVEGNPNELQMTAANGDRLVGENGPITVPAGFSSINIGSDGAVQVTMPDQTIVNAGRLSLVEVTRPQLLESTGDNRYRVEPGTQLDQALIRVQGRDGFIQQGALEQSNVDVSHEMTQLLTTQRSYQMNAKAVTMADQMMGLVNSIR